MFLLRKKKLSNLTCNSTRVSEESTSQTVLGFAKIRSAVKSQWSLPFSPNSSKIKICNCTSWNHFAYAYFWFCLCYNIWSYIIFSRKRTFILEYMMMDFPFLDQKCFSCYSSDSSVLILYANNCLICVYFYFFTKELQEKQLRKKKKSYRQ